MLVDWIFSHIIKCFKTFSSNTMKKVKEFYSESHPQTNVALAISKLSKGNAIFMHLKIQMIRTYSFFLSNYRT